MKSPTGTMKLFGREFPAPCTDFDDGNIWCLTIGVLEFRVHLHGKTFPDSPWSGWSGEVYVADRELARFYERDEKTGFPKTPDSTLAWLENEGRRIAREMAELCG